MELKENNGRFEVELPGALDLVAAVELRDILLESLANDSANDVVLTARAVERTSTAVIQVILAGAASFGAVSRQLEIAGATDSLAAAFRHLGLAEDFANLSVS